MYACRRLEEGTLGGKSDPSTKIQLEPLDIMGGGEDRAGHFDLKNPTVMIRMKQPCMKCIDDFHPHTITLSNERGQTTDNVYMKRNT